jgi:hypothetical protein
MVFLQISLMISTLKVRKYLFVPLKYEIFNVNLYEILQLFFSPASSGVAGRGLSDGTYEYSRRVFGSVLSDVSRRADRQPVPYPSY